MNFAVATEHSVLWFLLPLSWMPSRGPVKARI